MAKLPKVKNKQEEVDDEVVTTENEVTTDTSTDDGTADDQNGAVDSIITHTAETVYGSDEGSTDEDPDGGDKEDSTDKEKTDGGEENKKDDDNFGVTIAPPKNPTPTKATTVKVATVCDHSCYIGGKPYHFKKGVPTNVPEPVKQILKNAGLLAAL